MKTRLAVLIFLTITNYALAQETESELDKRNGFKGIKLGSPIDSVKGVQFKKDFKEKGHPAQLHSIDHPDYQSIGDVKVESIEVKTYKGLIYEIFVVTEKDERLMKGMERALGPAAYNLRDGSYNWVGKKGSLKFKSHSKSQLELLYTSYIVHKMMKEDKSKKIDDISGDF